MTQQGLLMNHFNKNLILNATTPFSIDHNL